MKNDPSSPSSSKQRSSAADAVAGEAALDWALREGISDRVLGETANVVRNQRRRRVRVWSTIGACVLAFGVSLSWWQGGLRDLAGVGNASAVVVSIPITRNLEDGSVVELAEHAEIQVEFTPHVRRIFLKRGEAHFSVASNPSRPFIVSAGGVEARAIGTAFAVQLGQNSVEVLVTHGKVEVQQTPSPSVVSPEFPEVRPVAQVDAGYRVVVDRQPSQTPIPIQPVSSDEAESRLAWRIPRVDLSGTPLSALLPVFNQHGSQQLALADPSLGQLEISGVLRADNESSLLRLLDLEFGIKSRQEGQRIILYRP